MAQITQEMKALIESQQCFHATVSTDGIPNNVLKRSMHVFDETTLMFPEGTEGRTSQNILNGSSVAVAVVNRDNIDGYQFLGTPDAFTSGDL